MILEPMKTKYKLLSGLALVLSLLSLFLTLPAFAQDTNPPAPPKIPDVITESVPWLDTIMKLNDVAIGLPAIPVVIIGCIMVGYFLKLIPVFPNQWIPAVVILAGLGANLLVTPLDSGINILRAITFGMLCGGLAIWIHQKQLKDVIDVNSLKNGVGVLLASAGLLLGVTACNTVQVKPGADAIVVHAEWTAENATSAFNSYFEWAAANWSALSPALRERTIALRNTGDQPGQAKRAILELRGASEEYKRVKTAENGAQVKALTASLLATVNSVRAAQGLPALALPQYSPSATELMNQFTNAPPAAPAP